jgi:hypothetical protein
MAANKKRAKAPESVEPIEPEETLTEEEILKLDYGSFDLLSRAMRFMVGIQTPSLLTRARREGYSSEEHQLGQTLWKRASGLERPLDHFFARGVLALSDSAEAQRCLQDIDGFENTWFPRTRAIIRRAVPVDRRDAFEAAFFADLTQQPLGPAVVGSVTTYLTRVEGLEQSAQPDAKAVRQLLQQRGLTPGKIADVRRVIAQLGELTPPAVPTDTTEYKQADAAQREALQQLADWYRDWATTLRTVFATREQLKLGLTRPPRRGGASEGEPGDAALEEEVV